MHQLNTREDDARSGEGFESEHGPRDSLNRAMVLFNNVVEILHLSNPVMSKKGNVIFTQLRGGRSSAFLRDAVAAL